MKDGADRQGRLGVTRGAFVEGGSPGGPLDFPTLPAVTAFTHKTLWPSLIKQVLLARLVRAKFFDPFRQRHLRPPPLGHSIYLNYTMLSPLTAGSLTYLMMYVFI